VRQARARGPLAEDEFAAVELHGISSEQLIAQVVEQSPTLAAIFLILFLAAVQAQSIPALADQAEQIEKELSRLITVFSLLTMSKIAIQARNHRRQEGERGGEFEASD